MTLSILASIVLPSLITGGLAYYFFMIHLKNEDKRRSFLLLKENRKQSFPIRLQAFERITLFLERINPSQLLVRVKPLGENKEAYASLLTSTIEQEFEHNVSQQIYLSESCWNVVVSSKNATLQIINSLNSKEEIKDAQSLREAILKKMMDGTPPSAVALSFVKEEVAKLL